MTPEDRANAEDWRDWVPDAPEPDTGTLLTRAEVLTALRDRVEPAVSESDLRFWEYRGVLPRPVRRRKDGATRALYPRWFVSLVFRLRAFQRIGVTLAAMPGRMRAEARQLAHDRRLDAGESWYPEGLRAADSFHVRSRGDTFPLLLAGVPTGYPFSDPALPGEVEQDLQVALARLAMQHREHDGVAIDRATIYLKDQHGQAISYDLTVPSLAEAAEILRARAEQVWAKVLPRAQQGGEALTNPVGESGRT